MADGYYRSIGSHLANRISDRL